MEQSRWPGMRVPLPQWYRRRPPGGRRKGFTAGRRRERESGWVAARLQRTRLLQRLYQRSRSGKDHKPRHRFAETMMSLHPHAAFRAAVRNEYLSHLSSFLAVALLGPDELTPRYGFRRALRVGGSLSGRERQAAPHHGQEKGQTLTNCSTGEGI